MKNEIKVNESIANLFFDQCFGSYSGHMSSIPNNPTLKSICEACGVKSKNDFKEFLKLVSDNIERSNF